MKRDTQKIPAVIWTLAALAVGVRIGVALATHFTQEDALITLRYAENIASGQGFAFNPGERVLGTTTPLYTLLLALAAWAHLPALTLGKAVNILADGFLCAILFRWGRAIGCENAGRLAAFLAAVNPIQIRIAISGQESSLAACLGAWAWLAYTEKRNKTAFFAAALLFLVRWDGLILLGALFAATVWRDRRVPVREMILYAAVIAPWLLWAGAYFGSPIPVTLAAKATVYGWRYQSLALPELHKLTFRLYGTPIYAIVTLTVLLGVFRVWRERLFPLWPPIVWFALYWGAFLASKVLLFEWYLVPPLPIYTLLAGLGLDALTRRARLPKPAVIFAAFGLTVVSVFVTGLVSRRTQRVEDNLRIPMGRWMRAHSRPDETIFLEPIGYVGYFSRRPILDPVGLVTPKVLKFYRPENPAPWLSMTDAFAPDWCVLRPGELARMERAAAVSGRPWPSRYAFVRQFSYTDDPKKDPAIFLIYRRR